jgi:hypothetical protein
VRSVRGRRRLKIAGIAIAILGLDVAGFCAWRALAHDPYQEALSVGWMPLVPGFEPIGEALRRRMAPCSGFPSDARELLELDAHGQPWIASPQLLDDAYGRRVDLRVEDTDHGERCSVWSLGADGRRSGDDVCLGRLEVWFGGLETAVPVELATK